MGCASFATGVGRRDKEKGHKMGSSGAREGAR